MHHHQAISKRWRRSPPINAGKTGGEDIGLELIRFFGTGVGFGRYGQTIWQDRRTVVQNNQESGCRHWAISCLFIHLLVLFAYSFAPLIHSLVLCYTLFCLLTHSLTLKLMKNFKKFISHHYVVLNHGGQVVRKC